MMTKKEKTQQQQQQQQQQHNTATMTMTTSLLDDLRENRVSLLQLVLVPELLEAATSDTGAASSCARSQLDLLLDALAVNDSIVQVQVRCSGSFVQSMNNKFPELWPRLFQALLGLPNLVSSEWQGCSSSNAYHTEEDAVPVAALLCHNKSSCLQHFSLSHVLMRGSSKDYEMWADWVKQQTALRECFMTHYGMLVTQEEEEEEEEEANDDEERPGALELVLKSLSSLPVLEDLEMSHSFCQENALPNKSRRAILSQLTKTRSLRRLYLTDVWLSYGDAVTLFRQLESNTSLQELAISTALAVDVGQALARLLSRNHTLLGVALRVDMLQDVECNAELARAIASSSSCLEMFALTAAQAQEYLPISSLQDFVNAMQTNERLEFLQLPVDPTCHDSARLSWELYSSLEQNVARRLLTSSSAAETSKTALHQSPNCVMAGALCGSAAASKYDDEDGMVASTFPHHSIMAKVQGSTGSLQDPCNKQVVAKKRPCPYL